MSDHPADATPPGGGSDHFDLADRKTVDVWTQSLGISEDDLRQAVAAAGTEVGPLYDHIQRLKRGRPSTGA